MKNFTIALCVALMTSACVDSVDVNPVRDDEAGGHNGCEPLPPAGSYGASSTSTPAAPIIQNPPGSVHPAEADAGVDEFDGGAAGTDAGTIVWSLPIFIIVDAGERDQLDASDDASSSSTRRIH